MATFMSSWVTRKCLLFDVLSQGFGGWYIGLLDNWRSVAFNDLRLIR